ncbi:MAG: hypothetical protein JST82_15160 [Bacteroidetes bacterium]|nr:hypothetical protein [Bacteroidota bacterium]
MNNYDGLISRLDAFIRKYYANQVLRGTLILLTCLLAYILTVSVSEYYLFLPVWAKVSIVSVFIIAGLSALIIWVAIPLSKMIRLGKVISHEQAAIIVGRHFPEVSDKLLNILQLRNHADSNASRELALASIDQKASQLSIVPFVNAIDLGKNKKYLPYLLPLILIIGIILVAAPNVFSDATGRLLQPTKTFEKPAPFKFIIKNEKLQTVRNADFVLNVTTDGNALPSDMYVVVGDEKVLMQSSGKNEFHYTFRNITEPVELKLYASGFYSTTYTIAVVQKPVIKSFSVLFNYPDYTGKKDEEKSSLGDVIVPQGTILTWQIATEHTDEAFVRIGDGNVNKLALNSGKFSTQFRFMNDTSYRFFFKNNSNNIIDSVTYHVKVINDEYPVVQLQEFRDSVSGTQVVLNGMVGDDYGISKLAFHYNITDAQNKNIVSKELPIKNTGGNAVPFQYYFDIASLNLQTGQQLSYYIETWDNDGVHGSKASRSEVMNYKMYDAKQLDSAINANSDQISSGLSNSSEHTQELQSEYKDLQSKMLQSENMEWEQKESLKQLSNKQQDLQSQLEAVKKRLDEQIQQTNQKEFSEDLKAKQQDMQKQMDNLLNKELREQMKKLQDLMQKLNKDKAMQAMKQLEQENKLFNMDLKRMQELMKQMEMQMRMEDLANKMDDLSEKQTELKKETDKGKNDNKELAQKQEELKKDLDKKMDESMKEMNNVNKEMERKQNLDELAKKGNEAKKNMDESKEQLNSGQTGKSSKSQNQAAQNLKDMASGLRSAAGGMDIQQIEQDIRTVRQILSNLVRLSFDEEQLMKKVQNTPITTQSYVNNEDEQKRLHANSRMIRDSLFSLSKKSTKLAVTVNKETSELEKSIASAIDALEGRRIADAATRQQYAMTHTNNLALMLNEMLSNLMQMQSQAKQGQKGMCNNPGGQTPKPGTSKQLSDIITQQQNIGDMMQQMQNAKEKKGSGDSKSDNGKPQNAKDGQQSAGGENGDAEQLSKLAQQQAAIRRQLQQLNSLLNSKGLGNAKELKEIQDKMDKTETDLVNKRLSNELLLRQKEILTRLLQAEKSLREQEQDDKRSSKSADDISRPVPPELKKYLNNQTQLLEQYKTVPPQLKPYYKNMVQQYFQAVGNK